MLFKKILQKLFATIKITKGLSHVWIFTIPFLLDFVQVVSSFFFTPFIIFDAKECIYIYDYYIFVADFGLSSIHQPRHDEQPFELIGAQLTYAP